MTLSTISGFADGERKPSVKECGYLWNQRTIPQSTAPGKQVPQSCRITWTVNSCQHRTLANELLSFLQKMPFHRYLNLPRNLDAENQLIQPCLYIFGIYYLAVSSSCSSCDLWSSLWHARSSCHSMLTSWCSIGISDSGIEPRIPALGVQSLSPLETPGKSQTVPLFLT